MVWPGLFHVAAVLVAVAGTSMVASFVCLVL